MSTKIFVLVRDLITCPNDVLPSALSELRKAASLPVPETRTQTRLAAAIALKFKDILCGGGLGEFGTKINGSLQFALFSGSDRAF